MKVDMKNVEKKVGGMFSKKTLYGIELTVTFNEEERAIITERKLADVNILEREFSADFDVGKEANRSLVGKIAKAVVSGTERLNPNLTIQKLLDGPDTHFFLTPIEAKNYTVELREKLPEFKDYIMNNAETGKDDSFEL